MTDFSFERITGRRRGQEDQRAPLRKGIAGDWRNYLEGDPKERFKETFGEHLVRTGYEEGTNW